MKSSIKYFLLSILNTIVIIFAFELSIYFYKYIYSVSKESISYGLSIKYYLLIHFIYLNIAFQFIKKINWYVVFFVILSFFIFSIYFLSFRYHPYKHSLLVLITVLMFFFSVIFIKRSKK